MHLAEQSGLIPIGQAARLLMISEERIRQLQKQGYIPKADKRGVVQLVGAVQGYLRYLKDDERRSAKSAADMVGLGRKSTKDATAVKLSSTFQTWPGVTAANVVLKPLETLGAKGGSEQATAEQQHPRRCAASTFPPLLHRLPAASIVARPRGRVQPRSPTTTSAMASIACSTSRRAL